MSSDPKIDLMDNTEILIDQVGRLTEGLTDLKGAVEQQLEVANRQAATVERLITEGFVDLKSMIAQQLEVANRQAATAEQPSTTVSHLAGTVERQALMMEQLLQGHKSA